MNIGCQGSGCQQGRTPQDCDCWLANRELAADVNDAWHLLGHRIVEWACVVGVVAIVYAIAFRGF